MKVSELVEKLQALPQDLELYIEADHGQQAESCGSVETYVDVYDYSMAHVLESYANVEDSPEEYDLTKEEFDKCKRVVIIYS